MLNNFISQNKIAEEDILKCIAYKVDNEKVTVIYQRDKVKLFFLIIYIKIIPVDMPYTILNECIQIFQKSKYNELEKTIIIPIILAFGNIDKSKKIQRNFKITTQEGNIINLRYNIIDIKNSKENRLFKDLNYIENK